MENLNINPVINRIIIKRGAHNRALIVRLFVSENEIDISATVINNFSLIPANNVNSAYNPTQ